MNTVYGCTRAHYAACEWPALCDCACHDSAPAWHGFRARAAELWARWAQ